jgi:hypothetical protein
MRNVGFSYLGAMSCTFPHLDSVELDTLKTSLVIWASY